MYGKGSIVLPPVAVLGTATVLPNTGMNLAIQLAIAAAAGLAVWAVVYGLNVKLGGR